MTTLLAGLLGAQTLAIAVVYGMYRRARKAKRVRRVEAPNSQYKSRYVLDLEAKDRWETMDLDRLHEVNQEEVRKVLAKLRATSVRALTKHERDFLDRMADAHDRPGDSRPASAGGRRPSQGGQTPTQRPQHVHGTS